MPTTPEDVVKSLLDKTEQHAIPWRIDGQRWYAEFSDDCSCELSFNGRLTYWVDRNSDWHSDVIPREKTAELVSLLSKHLPVTGLSMEQKLTKFLKCIENQ